MASILIIYSSTDGQTKKICLRLKEVVESYGDSVSVVSIDDADSSGLAAFDKIVIGASIRYGKHNRKVYDFIERQRDLLDSRPNAFFTVNVVARKPDKNTPETNPYLKKFLRQISWKPSRLGVFAGKINYRLYTLRDRMVIRFIMWLTRGPTDPDTNIEFTDWEQVGEFGSMIHEM